MSNLKCVYIHYCGSTNEPIYVGMGSILRPFSIGPRRSKDHLDHIIEHGVNIRIIERNLSKSLAQELEEMLISEIGIDKLYNKLINRSDWCKENMIGVNRGRVLVNGVWNKGKKLNKITGKYT